MSQIVPTDEVRLSSQDRLLALIRSKHPDYHPVMAMVEIALGEERAGDEGDRALAFACHKEVAKYTVAVDRVSEIKAEVTKTRRVVVEMFGAPSQEQKDRDALRTVDMQYASPPDKPALANDMSPVLGVAAQDVAAIRATVKETGPVEDHPEEPFASKYLQVDEVETEQSLTARFS